ncbi:MAG TPA: hypothetical protein VHD83_25875 [Puia sp.]|nr:hypothetical protein [Puia sp.]
MSLDKDICVIADSLRQRSKEELQDWFLDQLIRKGSPLLKRSYPNQFEFYVYIKAGHRRAGPGDIYKCLGAEEGLRELPTIYISISGYTPDGIRAARLSGKNILLLETSQLIADMRFNEVVSLQPYTIYFYPNFDPSNLNNYIYP